MDCSKKKVVKLSIVCSIVTVVIITIASVISFHNREKNKSMAANVADICNEINDDINAMSSISPEIAMSSNPFDYIENSDGYDKLVNLGVEAIPTLEECIRDGDGGLISYMLAVAMEEIAKCSVYEVTGIDWSTSKEFESALIKLKNESYENIEDIIKSDIDIDKKIEQLKPYGVFVIPVIDSVEQNMNTRKFSNINIEDMKAIANYKEEYGLTTDEVELLTNYMQN